MLLSRLFVVSLVVAGCSKRVAEPVGESFKPAAVPADPAAPTKLEITDDTVGRGKEAKVGDTVRVHYTGTLMNGTKFDSSRDRGEPFAFMLGARQVIAGWDQGVAGMRVGGSRSLTIPPDLGYGARGAGGVIPPNAVLVFEIELLEVR
jgi:FKBP-type peptidyl-prolyl cis-trans isomerase